VSVQFGRWNFDGRPADREYLAKADALLAPYGPDGRDTYIKDSVGILFRAFHTTKESRNEAQPYITHSSAVITWDGRLDNRADLIRELRDILDIRPTDVSIVAAAYERWGTECFAKLVGDWALSIWNPRDRSLILTKDPIGTRHLYYSLDKDQVSWSTILDSLVLLAGKTFALEEEYIAGWLGFFPATHLTPYVGIHSVPPSSLVLICPGKQIVSKYWDFDSGKKIRYCNDAEYEEHFRSVFTESVRRRLRSDSPIVAELSGGIDSTSIVCMSDAVIARGIPENLMLETVSYFDDSEPNWDERPYFTQVEQRRGKTGLHIDVGSREFLKFNPENEPFEAIPGSAKGLKGPAEQFSAFMKSLRSRVVLSGIGGDEVMGGVPTPLPELQDLLVSACFQKLYRQLRAWALNKRKPWIHLLFEAVRGFFPVVLLSVPKDKRPPSWLNPAFAQKYRTALRGYDYRCKLLDSLPSFQENLSTLDVLRRQLGCCGLSANPPYEKRYPYLDRSLLEYIYAVPREQIVRVNQRRSLMRRALAGLVPNDILNRKRKAHLVRAPLVAIANDWDGLVRMASHMMTSSLGFVEAEVLIRILLDARRGQQVATVPMLRTIALENWVQSLSRLHLLNLVHLEIGPIHAALADSGPGAGGLAIPRKRDSLSSAADVECARGSRHP
jgi:asparagine synthase (glutamine-hydrolysing)